MSTPLPLAHGLAAAAAGGALGTLARWSLLAAAPAAGFPWAVVLVNVVGSTLLAALPLVAAVRRSPLLTVFLGTGVCGGFTTMSTAAVDALGLLQQDRLLAGAAYVLATLGGALLGVLLVRRLGGRSS